MTLGQAADTLQWYHDGLNAETRLQCYKDTVSLDMAAHRITSNASVNFVEGSNIPLLKPPEAVAAMDALLAKQSD